MKNSIWNSLSILVLLLGVVFLGVAVVELEDRVRVLEDPALLVSPTKMEIDAYAPLRMEERLFSEKLYVFHVEGYEWDCFWKINGECFNMLMTEDGYLQFVRVQENDPQERREK